jgi:hypothetical protein
VCLEDDSLSRGVERRGKPRPNCREKLDNSTRFGQSPRVPSSFETDVSSLARWWADHAASATDGVHGLWFGLADLVGDDGEVRHCMYVAGTPDFSADDGGDWACEYVWEPSDQNLQLDGLAAIELKDWTAAVEHAVAVASAVRPWETVHAICETLESASTTATSTSSGLAHSCVVRRASIPVRRKISV